MIKEFRQSSSKASSPISGLFSLYGLGPGLGDAVADLCITLQTLACN